MSEQMIGPVSKRGDRVVGLAQVAKTDPPWKADQDRRADAAIRSADETLHSSGDAIQRAQRALQQSRSTPLPWAPDKKPGLLRRLRVAKSFIPGQGWIPATKAGKYRLKEARDLRNTRRWLGQDPHHKDQHLPLEQRGTPAHQSPQNKELAAFNSRKKYPSGRKNVFFGPNVPPSHDEKLLASLPKKVKRPVVLHANPDLSQAGVHAQTMARAGTKKPAHIEYSESASPHTFHHELEHAAPRRSFHRIAAINQNPAKVGREEARADVGATRRLGPMPTDRVSGYEGQVHLHSLSRGNMFAGHAFRSSGANKTQVRGYRDMRAKLGDPVKPYNEATHGPLNRTIAVTEPEKRKKFAKGLRVPKIKLKPTGRKKADPTDPTAQLLANTQANLQRYNAKRNVEKKGGVTFRLGRTSQPRGSGLSHPAAPFQPRLDYSVTPRTAATRDPRKQPLLVPKASGGEVTTDFNPYKLKNMKTIRTGRTARMRSRGQKFGLGEMGNFNVDKSYVPGKGYVPAKTLGRVRLRQAAESRKAKPTVLASERTKPIYQRGADTQRYQSSDSKGLAALRQIPTTPSGRKKVSFSTEFPERSRQQVLDALPKKVRRPIVVHDSRAHVQVEGMTFGRSGPSQPSHVLLHPYAHPTIARHEYEHSQPRRSYHRVKQIQQDSETLGREEGRADARMLNARGRREPIHSDYEAQSILHNRAQAGNKMAGAAFNAVGGNPRRVQGYDFVRNKMGQPNRSLAALPKSDITDQIKEAERKKPRRRFFSKAYIIRLRPSGKVTLMEHQGSRVRSTSADPHAASRKMAREINRTGKRMSAGTHNQLLRLEERNGGKAARVIHPETRYGAHEVPQQSYDYQPGRRRVSKVDTTMSDADAKRLAAHYDTRGPLPKKLSRETRMRAYEARYIASGGREGEKWKRRADLAETGRNIGLAGATIGAATTLAARHKRLRPHLARVKVNPHGADNATIGAAAFGGASELYGEHARSRRASYQNSPAGVAGSALSRMQAYTPEKKKKP